MTTMLAFRLGDTLRIRQLDPSNWVLEQYAPRRKRGAGWGFLAYGASPANLAGSIIRRGLQHLVEPDGITTLQDFVDAVNRLELRIARDLTSAVLAADDEPESSS